MPLTSLYPYFDPANYHPDAVAAAQAGEIDTLDVSLSLLRLCIELHKNDQAAALSVVLRLNREPLGGYQLWQKLTAALILALESLCEPEIKKALTAWLDGRDQYPGNWRNEVLDAPEVVPWLGRVDPARLIAPVIKPSILSPEERAFVRDIKSVCENAVRDNLTYLRDLGVKQSAATLAKKYTLLFVNLALRECTIDAGEDLPSITVALDEQGAYVGSFLTH
jgi:hypothetical protein